LSFQVNVLFEESSEWWMGDVSDFLLS